MRDVFPSGVDDGGNGVGKEDFFIMPMAKKDQPMLSQRVRPA